MRSACTVVCPCACTSVTVSGIKLWVLQSSCTWVMLFAVKRRRFITIDRHAGHFKPCPHYPWCTGRLWPLLTPSADHILRQEPMKTVFISNIFTDREFSPITWNWNWIKVFFKQWCTLFHFPNLTLTRTKLKARTLTFELDLQWWTWSKVIFCGHVHRPTQTQQTDCSTWTKADITCWSSS